MAIQSLNTALSFNSPSAISFSGSNTKPSAKLPVSQSDKFVGKAVHQERSLSKALRQMMMVGTMALASLGFSNCTPGSNEPIPVTPPVVVDPPVVPPVVTPPVSSVDKNKNLNSLQIAWKELMTPYAGLDSTSVGKVSQIKLNNPTSGEDIEFIEDELKSTKDTLYFKEIVSTGPYIDGKSNDKFFIGKDGKKTLLAYTEDGTSFNTFKYEHRGNTVFESINKAVDAYKFTPGTVVGQAIKTNTSVPDKHEIVKLISKTMKVL